MAALVKFSEGSMDSPAATVPLFLRPQEAPLGGVQLKEAQLLTQRLLSSSVPHYKVLPLPPAEQTAVYEFLNGSGFDSLHPSLDPASKGTTAENKRPYGVPVKRAEKKRIQIANLIAAIAAVAPSIKRKGRGSNNPRTFVDFCGGCGHAGLVIAALYPSWIVHIVDAKPAALAIAKKRAKEAGLQNVRVFEGDLLDFDAAFDFGVALHACGGASDAVIAKCVLKGAAIAISPCCVGGVVSEKGSVTGLGSGARIADFANAEQHIDFSVARSRNMREKMTSDEFVALARAADYGESGSSDPWRRVAKSLIELDRCAWLKEGKYDSVLVKMMPLWCSPKNDLLIAFPEGSLTIKWDTNEETNAALAKVQQGSGIDGFEDDEKAHVEQQLRSTVMRDGGPGEVEFPCATGRRERKLVHAVAKKLGLYSESCGRGSRRRVKVSLNRYWPLYDDHYIGVAGAQVQRVGEMLARHVPDEARETREEARGKKLHVTVVGPPEFRMLLQDGMFAERADLLEFLKRHLERSQFTARGVGMTSEDDCTAYFAVLDWPAAQHCRAKLGLPHEDLHITLGFTNFDIHNVDKSIRTLTVAEERICIPWASN